MRAELQIPTAFTFEGVHSWLQKSW